MEIPAHEKADNKSFYEDVALTSLELDEITSGMTIVEEEASMVPVEEDIEGDPTHTAVDMNSGKEEVVAIEDLDMSMDEIDNLTEDTDLGVDLGSSLGADLGSSLDSDLDSNFVPDLPEEEDEEDEGEEDGTSSSIIAEFEAQLAAKKSQSVKKQSPSKETAPASLEDNVLDSDTMDSIVDGALDMDDEPFSENNLPSESQPENELDNLSLDPMEGDDAIMIDSEISLDGLSSEPKLEIEDVMEGEDAMDAVMGDDVMGDDAMDAMADDLLEEEPAQAKAPSKSKGAAETMLDKMPESMDNLPSDTEAGSLPSVALLNDKEEAVKLSRNELDNIVDTLDKSGGNIKSITPMTSTPSAESEVVGNLEFKDLFKYIDQLLGHLPQDKIDAFSRSKYYKQYHHIMTKFNLK